MLKLKYFPPALLALFWGICFISQREILLSPLIFRCDAVYAEQYRLLLRPEIGFGIPVQIVQVGGRRQENTFSKRVFWQHLTIYPFKKSNDKPIFELKMGSLLIAASLDRNFFPASFLLYVHVMAQDFWPTFWNLLFYDRLYKFHDSTCSYL